MDIQTTKDNKIIIYHDYYLKEASKKIKALTNEQIKNTYKKTNIPQLKDIIPLLKKIKILNIEIKSNSLISNGIERKIIIFINQNKIKHKTIISSFNPLVLRRVKKIDNSIWTGYLYSKVEVPIILKTYFWIYFVKPNSFHPDYNFARKKMVDWAKKKGMKTIIFTVNTKEQYENVKSWGVDGIFTDDPEKLRQIQCD